MPANCFVCDDNARIGSLAPRDEIFIEGAWRVAHAFGTSLPGWLVVVPTTHVTALQQLPAADVSLLGVILHRVSRALEEVLGAEKAYFVFFAESADCHHVHVHVIPRMSWFTAEQRGPNVFQFLGVSESDAVPEAERDALALALRAALRGSDRR
jgi:diadenosine tetraphosphate (Ap4A) HIT family hydrolase